MTRLTSLACLALPLALAAAAGCSVKDPLFCDATHPCTDPALAYCDTTGAYAPDHIANTCIASPFDAAPICTPGAFDRCDGDTLYRCDATGYAYEPVTCELGCSAAAGACRLCTPSSTACTNGTVASCDANGDVVSSKACPLGCFQDQPRCTDVDPSNGLAPYLDLTTAVGVDLDLTDGAIIDTSTGAIKNGDGSSVVVTNTLIAAPANGVPIRVFIVKSAHLRNVRFESTARPAPAFALVADGAISVAGSLDATGYIGTAPGVMAAGPCTGSSGTYINEPNNRTYVMGCGGGGYATSGGAGGGINNLGGGAGGAAGQAFVNPSLTPLRGGCDGAGYGDGAESGGGAIQFVSRTRIDLGAAATINANGNGGAAPQQTQGGGGSGGGILLEAPEVSLAAGAALVANGGGGASTDNGGSAGLVAAMGAPGGACAVQTSRCGAGGVGASANAGPGVGGSADYTNATNAYVTAGGGGGSVGYVRVNTSTATYTKASDVIESPAPSTGTLKTR
ncbi:MAG: hypothetical protein K8W52_03490 [Deltaproteobacteria bacterium]|nr:hypothetical protein [Deltaproteobacteria bacterium]